MGLLPGCLSYAATNARNRPTVISNVSSQKVLTHAGYMGSLLRLYNPPSTRSLWQQLSLPSCPHVGGNPAQFGRTAHSPATQAYGQVSTSSPPSRSGPHFTRFVPAHTT